MNGPHTINFLFEAFSERAAKYVLENVKAGAKVCCIVTEDPNEDTWNGIRQGQPGARMKDRMRWFKYLLERNAFCALMYFVPHAEKQLAKWHKNIAHVEIGWSDTREALIEEEFDRLGWVRGDAYNPATAEADLKAFGFVPGEPEHPFGFFGGKTPRRNDLLGQIEARGYHIHTLSKGIEYDLKTGQAIIDYDRALKQDYGPRDIRDRAMTNAKILLGPAAFAKWGIFSASRALTCMVLRRAHVAEKTKPSVWHEILGDGYIDRFGPAFVDGAIKLLPRWRELAQEQRARCKELLPASKTIGPAVEKLFPEVLAMRQEAA